MGTALSAPFVVLAVHVGLSSMLVLGDGLCPSMCLALITGGLFLYVTSMKRLDILKTENRSGFDLMQTPWLVILPWQSSSPLHHFLNPPTMKMVS